MFVCETDLQTNHIPMIESAVTITWASWIKHHTESLSYPLMTEYLCIKMWIKTNSQHFEGKKDVTGVFYKCLWLISSFQVEVTMVCFGNRLLAFLVQPLSECLRNSIIVCSYFLDVIVSYCKGSRVALCQKTAIKIVSSRCVFCQGSLNIF